MTPAAHVAFDLHDPSQVGEVRRAALRLADTLGFDEVAAGRVALVATELGNNLVRHATDGRLLLGTLQPAGQPPQVELLSLDQGPGMANLAACMADGFSTGGTPGTGLGAVRRLSDEFDAYTAVPGGTVILSRIGTGAVAASRTGMPEPTYRVGAVALAAPGETVCGDAWAFAQDQSRASLLVADGLGHGPSAAEASGAAVQVFESAPFQGPASLLERMHARLRSTRGAAVALVEVDLHQLVFCGAGNVVGRVISGHTDRSLLSQHGTAGLQIRKPQPQRSEWPDHALLVLHSDGLQSRWRLDSDMALLQRHPTLVAAWLVRSQTRGRDDVTVVVVKRQA